MKMLKIVVTGLGALILGVGVYWFVNGWVQLDRMITAVHTTAPRMDSPRPEYNAAVLFALLGGLLLGLGIGLPSQLASRARRQTLREVNERVGSIDPDADRGHSRTSSAPDHADEQPTER